MCPIFYKQNDYTPKNCVKRCKASCDNIILPTTCNIFEEGQEDMSACANKAGKSHLLIEKFTSVKQSRSGSKMLGYFEIEKCRICEGNDEGKTVHCK